MNNEVERKLFVDFLESIGAIKDERIKKAFLEIPREIFVPQSLFFLGRVYTDEVIVTYSKNNKIISTSSQPSLMARMIELAGIKQGDRVLEIGTGTGYNAAIISKIVGKNGRVVTAEVEKELCEVAKNNFQKLDLKNVTVINSDGNPEDLKKFAPFDSIIITVGIDFPKKDFTFLINSNGKICFPLNFRTTAQNPVCVLLRRNESFVLNVEIAARFLMASGEMGWRNEIIQKLDTSNFEVLKPIDTFELEEFYSTRFVEFLELLTLSIYEYSGRLIYVDNCSNGLVIIKGKKAEIFGDTKVKRRILDISSLWNAFKKPSVFDFNFLVTYQHELPKIELTNQ